MYVDALEVIMVQYKCKSTIYMIIVNVDKSRHGHIERVAKPSLYHSDPEHSRLT